MSIKKVIFFISRNTKTIAIFSCLALISSCQKKNIPRSGLYSSFILNKGRTIASINKRYLKTDNLKIAYIQKPDERQVYLYCQVSAMNAKSCYNDQIKELLSMNKVTLTFEQVQRSVNAINKLIIHSAYKKFDLIVNHRLDFCKLYAKKDFQKCLSQYLEKESLKILHSLNPSSLGREASTDKTKVSLNGYEYIFLKRTIAYELAKKFKVIGKSFN